jgi:Fe-S oxidoreductase
MGMYLDCCSCKIHLKHHNDAREPKVMTSKLTSGSHPAIDFASAI